jgi:hypothetical protein
MDHFLETDQLPKLKTCSGVIQYSSGTTEIRVLSWLYGLTSFPYYDLLTAISLDLPKLHPTTDHNSWLVVSTHQKDQ